MATATTPMAECIPDNAMDVNCDNDVAPPTMAPKAQYSNLQLREAASVLGLSTETLCDRLGVAPAPQANRPALHNSLHWAEYLLSGIQDSFNAIPQIFSAGDDDDILAPLALPPYQSPIRKSARARKRFRSSLRRILFIASQCGTSISRSNP